jgi:hypothetical protein
MSFRRVRILLLLGVFAAVLSLNGLEQWMVRAWRAPLDVQVVPINFDGSAAAAAAIAALDASDFDDVDAFLEREVAGYGVRVSPAANFTVKPQLHARPPAPPQAGNVLQIMLWSLKLRWWVYRQSGDWLPQLGTIRLFLLYHTPEDEDVALPHSLGLQKGLIGVVHVFSDPRQARQNRIVIAHELLHTLGASDKYAPDGFPLYPQGYAEPELPQGPRRAAEIMAGRFVAASGEALMPDSLEHCVIGAQTAHEINLDAGFRNRFGG